MAGQPLDPFGLHATELTGCDARNGRQEFFFNGCAEEFTLTRPTAADDKRDIGIKRSAVFSDRIEGPPEGIPAFILRDAAGTDVREIAQEDAAVILLKAAHDSSLPKRLDIRTSNARYSASWKTSTASSIDRRNAKRDL
jgi:hypothetical protein